MKTMLLILGQITIKQKQVNLLKTKLIGSTPNDNILGAEVVPIKYLINFWRSLNFPLINCEIELYLS